MLNPQVVVDGDMALLTYNLVNYIQDPKGSSQLGLAGIQRRCIGAGWYMEGDPLALVVHSPHRVSEMSVEASEGQEA